MAQFSLAFWYGLFAVIATVANLSAQWITLRILPYVLTDVRRQWSLFRPGDLDLYVAMAAGTIVGLIAKYLMDKKYIFRFRAKSALQDLHKFFLYSLTGVFTTLIFWGTEIAFNAMLPYWWSKYFGACLGLNVGYVTKYFCDKKFVFLNR